MERILVVEDNKDVRENLKELLESSGYQVFAAKNGIEAINEFRKIKPDLILCDIMMPLMDGLEFYSIIRDEELLANTPFIFLTAKTDINTYSKAMNLGAEDYIFKPYNARELLQRVNLRLEKKKRIDEKFRKLQKDISLYVPHELQTPIFPIIGYSEMILNNYDDFSKFEILDMVKRIHNSAIRLKDRMEKFNKYAELEIQASECFKYNKDDLKKTSEISKDFICSITCDENLEIKVQDAKVRISERDLRTLLFELVENAQKFGSGDEKIIVHGSVENNLYKLFIQNKGELFDINELHGFEQVDRKRRQQVGNGLGLAIVHLIAKKYGLRLYSLNDEKHNKVFIEFLLTDE